MTFDGRGQTWFRKSFLLSSYSSDHIETRFRAEYSKFSILSHLICVKIDLESMTGNDWRSIEVKFFRMKPICMSCNNSFVILIDLSVIFWYFEFWNFKYFLDSALFNKWRNKNVLIPLYNIYFNYILRFCLGMNHLWLQ